jgi:hypothetical protein
MAEMDARQALLAERGVTIRCPDRTIGGYPFRMEIACTAPGVEIADRSVSTSAAGLRLVAQIWDPQLVILELDGPGIGGDGAGGTVSASWRTLRLSLRWATSGVRRASLAADGLDLTTRAAGRPATRLVAEHVETHGRPAGARDHDLDLALSFAAASLTIADKRVGPARADVAVATTLVDFLPAERGRLATGFAARGGRAEPTTVSLGVGGIRVEGAGKLVLDQTGVLDGMITLVANGLESLAKGGARDLGGELTAALTGFVLLGKPSQDPALPGRRLEMIVDHGLVRIGRVTLGRIPSLIPPGS